MYSKLNRPLESSYRGRRRNGGEGEGGRVPVPGTLQVLVQVPL